MPIPIQALLGWMDRVAPIDAAWISALRTLYERPRISQLVEDRSPARVLEEAEERTRVLAWLDERTPRVRTAIEEPTGMISDLANIVLAYLGYPTGIPEHWQVESDEEDEEAKGDD